MRSWLVCLSAAQFFLYSLFQINLFSAILPSLTAHYNESSTTIGVLSASYLIGNIVFLFPAGVLIDLYSPRKLILAAMSICITGTFIFAFADSVYIACLGRFISGASAGSFCFLVVIKLIFQWFKEEQLAFVTGIVIAFAMLGGVLSHTPFVWVVSKHGLRKALLINSFLDRHGVARTYLVHIIYPTKKHPQLQ